MPVQQYFCPECGPILQSAAAAEIRVFGSSFFRKILAIHFVQFKITIISIPQRLPAIS